MTARTDLELEDPILDLADEDEEELYYFYDDDENYWKLRQKRDDMPSKEHSELKRYLMEVLIWYYRSQICTIYEEFNFYQTSEAGEEPLYPDIAVLKGYTHQEGATSYRLEVTGPAPDVVIEIVSNKTRATDLNQKKKPTWYAQCGVKEYFAYDPRPRKRKTKTPRLWGWRLDGKVFQKLEPDENGWLWSEQLDSWLAPDGAYMRLYDRDKNLRLNEAEAEKQANKVLQREVDFLKERLRQLEQERENS